MLEEGLEEVLTAGFGHQGGGHLISEGLDILGDAVSHFPVLGVAPTILDGLKFRSIGREVGDMDTGAIERLEEPSGFVMATPAIPDDQQGALQMAVEVLHQGKDILPREIA